MLLTSLDRAYRLSRLSSKVGVWTKATDWTDCDKMDKLDSTTRTGQLGQSGQYKHIIYYIIK